MTLNQTANARSARTRSRRQLPKGARRAVLTIHIIAAGSWIGIDVVVAVLVGTGRLASDPALRGLAYEALGTFVAQPMLVAALVCLASGLLLGMATPYGVVRYWWVLVKLIATVALSAMILGVLSPGMPGVVEAGRVIAAGGTAPAGVDQLVYPPAVSLTVLTGAVLLSVFKPWGRIGRSGSR